MSVEYADRFPIDPRTAFHYDCSWWMVSWLVEFLTSTIRFSTETSTASTHAGLGAYTRFDFNSCRLEACDTPRYGRIRVGSLSTSKLRREGLSSGWGGFP